MLSLSSTPPQPMNALAQYSMAAKANDKIRELEQEVFELKKKLDRAESKLVRKHI